MTEDKRPDKTGRTQQGMFPDTWIVGPAAAVLAKNDVDVLLADDALAEPDTASSEVGVSTVDDALAKPATATSITPEQELAELRAENERLVRRAVGYSYRRLQPMLDRVEHFNAGRETAEVVDEKGGLPGDGESPIAMRAEHRLSAHPPGHRHRRPWRRALRLLLLIGVLAAVGLAGLRMLQYPGSWSERVVQLKSDVVDYVRRLDSGTAELSMRAGLNDLKARLSTLLGEGIAVQPAAGNLNPDERPASLAPEQASE